MRNWDCTNKLNSILLTINFIQGCIGAAHPFLALSTHIGHNLQLSKKRRKKENKKDTVPTM